jgi:hypothetical protein
MGLLEEWLEKRIRTYLGTLADTISNPELALSAFKPGGVVAVNLYVAWPHGIGSAPSAGQSALPVTRRAPSIVASHAAKPIVNAGMMI